MPERVIGFLQPIKDRWTALDQVQKIRIAAAVLVVLVILAITVFLTTRTVYQVAIRGLTHIDAMQVATILEENEIRNRIVPDGIFEAVEVDQDRVHDARLLIDTRGLVADRDFTYEDALSFSGIGATETVTRQNLLRARQTDLERAITAMDGVIWAQVELDLPDANRFFVQTTDPARASALIRSTRRLTNAEGAGIARFISRSVRGLELENIEVLDTDYNMLFSGQALEDEDSLLSELQELMVRQRTQVHGQVRDLFRHFYDNVEVASNLAYPRTMTNAERVTFAAPDQMEESGLVLTERTLNANARGVQTAFEPGLVPNQAVIPTYPFGVGGDMAASQAEADRLFALDELRESIVEIPSGFIPDQSVITVSLVRFVMHDQGSMMRRNGEFTEDDWLEFQMNTNHELIENDAQMLAYIQSVSTATGIPVDNITVRAWAVPQFVDYVPTPVALNQIIMYAILALLLGLLAFGLIRRTQMIEDEEIEPELSVEDLLVSTQMEEAIEEELLESIGFEEGSEAMRKINEFIDDKPEAAASLLRHWLNEAEI